jgi:hypothetical protein
MACKVHEKKTRAQPGVDRAAQAERHRDDLEQQFERGADRRPAPQIGARDGRERRERHRRTGIFAFPSV